MPGKELPSPCMDCHEAESVFSTRGRRLCRDCYKQFIGYKVFKRMERYRLRKDLPRTGSCKLLLPLSYGLSSTVLLRIVYSQMELQLSKPKGPPAFDLHILIVDPSSISPSSPPHNEAFNLLQQHFPLASFTRLPLHSVFKHDSDLQDILPKYAGNNFDDDTSLSSQQRLDAFRASITSATSRDDIDSVLLNRLIIAFAKSVDCVAILWGDSDNRLAAKTLASVAKGRGSSLTWQVSDGMSPFGLEFNFPLRDLFIAELQDYSSLCPELSDIIIPDVLPSENILTKNLSIDQLMLRYVATQGEKYPGIMSNVTRTANKLQASLMPTDGLHCSLCKAYIPNSEGVPNKVHSMQGSEDSKSREFCYACIRSRPELI